MWNAATLVINRTDESGNARVVIVYSGDAGEKKEDHLTVATPYTTNEELALRALAIQTLARLNAATGKVIGEGSTINVNPIVPPDPTPKAAWLAQVAKAQYVQRLEDSKVVPGGTAAPFVEAALNVFQGAFLDA